MESTRLPEMFVGDDSSRGYQAIAAVSREERRPGRQRSPGHQHRSHSRSSAFAGPTSKAAGSATLTPQEYAKWYAKHKGTDKVEGSQTPEEFAANFQQKLCSLLNKKTTTAAVPVLSLSSAYMAKKCRHCKSTFEHFGEGQLRRHEAECGVLTCEHCCQSFKTPLQLKGHLIVCDKHTQNRCEFCAPRIRDPRQKEAHEATCEQNPALWCDWCGVRFQHKALRVKHQHRCPRNPATFCPHCNEKFPSRLEAVVHSVFCSANTKTSAMPGLCSACCEQCQCIRFPCRSHLYCAQCVFQQVRHGLKDRSMLPLRCCRREVQPGDAVDLAVAQMLSESSREKYQEAMLLKVSKEVMYCPRADCGALIALDQLRDAGLSTEGPHGCPKCQQALCFACKSEWHAGMTCMQYKYVAAKSKDAITAFCLKMKWMRCFECGHVIEKRTGCNHITCICGSQFCYICGSKWGDCKCQVFDGGHALRHNRLPVADMHTCRWCRQAYPSLLELEAHTRICRARMDAAGGAYECSSCFQRFQSNEALTQHRRSCRALFYHEYTCSVCTATFEEQDALRRHRRICGIVVAGC